MTYPNAARNTFGKAFGSLTVRSALFHLLGAANVLFCLWAAFRCAFTKGWRRKWLWIPYILAPMVQFTLNLDTQGISFKTISFLLLGYGLNWSGNFGPVLISVAVPVGGIIFLVKSRGQKVREPGADGAWERGDDPGPRSPATAEPGRGESGGG